MCPPTPRAPPPLISTCFIPKISRQNIISYKSEPSPDSFQLTTDLVAITRSDKDQTFNREISNFMLNFVKSILRHVTHCQTLIRDRIII